MGASKRRSGNRHPVHDSAGEQLYQNDYWFKDVLLRDGVYPQPIDDAGVSRVDVRDIAEAAAIALTTSPHEGQTYELVGPQPVTGELTARIWSRALGKPIAYGGNDLDAWEKTALTYMPDWLALDARLQVWVLQEQGSKRHVRRLPGSRRCWDTRRGRSSRLSPRPRRPGSDADQESVNSGANTI